ncbi:MAG: hypothetical protein ACI9A0_001931, partial [Pseudoalteromonas tetraodonis]
MFAAYAALTYLAFFYHGDIMPLFRLCLLSATLLSLIGCSEPEKIVKEEPIRPVKLFSIGHDSQTNIRSFPAEVVANQGSYLAF